jgi:hypothetical protein
VVLDCLDSRAPPFSIGVRQLRAALDSRPWWGAGQVEDPDNLLGHALRKAVGVLARQQGWELPEGACETGVSLVGGRVSMPLWSWIGMPPGRGSRP